MSYRVAKWRVRSDGSKAWPGEVGYETASQVAEVEDTASECCHVWRPLGSPVSRMDGWGFYYRVIQWYCERCRKTEWGAVE